MSCLQLVSFIIGMIVRFIWILVREGFKDRWDAIFIWRILPRCELCHSWFSRLRLESSRTLYNFDGSWFNHNNPNKPQLYCPCCAAYHHKYWDDIWSEYRSSQF